MRASLYVCVLTSQQVCCYFICILCWFVLVLSELSEKLGKQNKIGRFAEKIAESRWRNVGGEISEWVVTDALESAKQNGGREGTAEYHTEIHRIPRINVDLSYEMLC